MREKLKRRGLSGISYAVLLMSLLLSLVVFSELSQARTHSDRIAEFTLSNPTIEQSGEFSLKREANARYPLSRAEGNVATPHSFNAYSERILSRTRSGIKEKTNDGQAIVFNKPPLSEVKVFGEFIAGSVLGTALGLGAAHVGTRITYNGRWFSDLPGAIIGFALAYPLGCALGVYSVGNIGSTTGSFASALSAAYGGLFVGAIGAYAINRVSRSASILVVLATPPLLATFAFNKSRRFKHQPATSVSLLNSKDGKMHLGLPAILVLPGIPGSSNLDWMVNLASVEF